MDTPALLRLVELVYECAIEPALWPSTLEQIAAAFDSAAGTLNVLDLVTGAERTLVYTGISDAYQALYRERYQGSDLFAHGMLLRPLDEPATSEDLVGEAELLGSRVYREWAAPQGFRHVLLTTLMRTQARLAFVGLTRTPAQGPYGAADKLWMGRLAPHVRRAVTIADLVDHKGLEHDLIHEAADALTTAILILDAAGRLAHANAAGHALLARGDLLAARAGLVEPWAQPGRWDEARWSRAGSLTLARRDGSQAIVSVLPLGSGRRRAAVQGRGHVALFVQDGAGAPNAVAVIGRIYGLTGGELRVLLGLAEGSAPKAIAARYGISESTVRGHLKSLFAKTGTGRQADLVALLGTAPPVGAARAPLADA